MQNLAQNLWAICEDLSTLNITAQGHGCGRCGDRGPWGWLATAVAYLTRCRRVLAQQKSWRQHSKNHLINVHRTPFKYEAEACNWLSLLTPP